MLAAVDRIKNNLTRENNPIELAISHVLRKIETVSDNGGAETLCWKYGKKHVLTRTDKHDQVSKLFSMLMVETSMQVLGYEGMIKHIIFTDENMLTIQKCISILKDVIQRRDSVQYDFQITDTWYRDYRDLVHFQTSKNWHVSIQHEIFVQLCHAIGIKPQYPDNHAANWGYAYGKLWFFDSIYNLSGQLNDPDCKIGDTMTIDDCEKFLIEKLRKLGVKVTYL